MNGRYEWSPRRMHIHWTGQGPKRWNYEQRPYEPLRRWCTTCGLTQMLFPELIQTPDFDLGNIPALDRFRVLTYPVGDADLT